MNALSVLKLTAYENYRGQILWVSVAVAAVTLFLTAFTSEAALSHQTRVVDVTAYFLVDIVSFLTAMFLGTSIFSKDFSNRGIAEIIIPGGLSRERLFLVRTLAHALCLCGFLLALHLGRLLVLLTTESMPPTLWSDTLHMLLFSGLKSTLALGLAALLGCFTRPVVALLGTAGLFALGHFSSGISGLQGVIADARMLTPVEAALFKIFRIWNPNYLVLESFKGAWEQPALAEFAGRAAWGLTAIAAVIIAGMLAVRRRDVGALQM